MAIALTVPSIRPSTLEVRRNLVLNFSLKRNAAETEPIAVRSWMNVNPAPLFHVWNAVVLRIERPIRRPLRETKEVASAKVNCRIPIRFQFFKCLDH